MTAENSGRVSTQEFYKALIEQTEKLGKMEVRIIDRINAGITSQQEYQTKVDARLAAGSVHFDKFEKDIDNLKLWDRGMGALTLVATAIATAIGIRK